MRHILARSYSLIILLAAWEFVCRAGLVPPVVLPSPSVLGLQVVGSFGDARFLDDFRLTLFRLFVGLAIALGCGVVFGITAAQSRAGAMVLEPLVRVLSPLPKIAFFPAFLLLLGFGNAPRIVLVVVDAIFPVLLAAYYGARAVDEKLLWSARAAGMSRGRCIIHVVLPAALPGILTGMRISVVIGCVVVFFAEMVAPGDGLGDMLIRAARSFETVQMFVPLVVISLLGYALDHAIQLFRNRFVFW